MGLARSGEEVRFLKGNHEEMFVAAARGKAQAARLFRRHGGVETLASYGLGPEDSARMSDERSEEHTSELQSLMRISYAVFCLKKKKNKGKQMKNAQTTYRKQRTKRETTSETLLER